MHEQIAITGLGCVSGLGDTPEAFVRGLFDGRTAMATPDFDTSLCASRVAAVVRDFRPEADVSPQRLRRVDRIGQFAIVACRRALDDAGLLGRAVGDRRTGVVLGTYTCGTRSMVRYLRNLLTQGALGASALHFSNTVGNAAASLCALEFRLQGPNLTVSNKEASSLAAIATAVSFLRQRRAEVIVTGGVDEVEMMFHNVHARFGVLAADGDDVGVSRPFDRRRSGYVLGEGAFLLVLEPASSAAARGARAHGTIVSAAGTGSSVRLNDWPDDPRDLARCMRSALEAGGVSPEEVQFVLASANSTPDLDRVEAAAIAQVFGARGVPVASIKGAIGESGISGAASLVAALHALNRGTVPPTPGCEQPDEDLCIDVAPVPRPIARRHGAGVALVNSFASGGALYSLLAMGRPA